MPHATGLYFYRHHRTHQLLIALSPAHLRSHARISHPTVDTPYLRRDLWTPILVATSTSAVFRTEVARGLRQKLLALPDVEKEMPSRDVRRTTRAKLEQGKVISHKLTQLCQMLHHWRENRVKRGKEVPELTLWWEEEGWKEFIEQELRAQGASVTEWPSFVSHKKLEFAKGRHMLNTEITDAPMEEPRRVQVVTE